MVGFVTRPDDLLITPFPFGDRTEAQGSSVLVSRIVTYSHCATLGHEQTPAITKKELYMSTHFIDIGVCRTWP